MSVLFTACVKGEYEIVKLLLENGAEVESQNDAGMTPMPVAVSAGNIKIVDVLFEHGAASDTLDYNGMSPVWHACTRGHRDMLMTLIRHGANLRRVEGGCSDPLCAVARLCPKDDVEEILKLLMSNGLCFNPAKRHSSQSALMIAAQRGRVDIINSLVKHGADMYERNFENMQPIDVASYSGHTDIVRFISSCNSSATVSRGCSLYQLSFGVDCRCNTDVHLTTDLQIMTSLLDTGADIEAENIDGLRPIHRAVRTGIVELVELLIQHGANVDAADVFGNRPLHDAVYHGLNVVQLLVQRAAKLNVQNIDGKTPLHIAVERRQLDVIMFLLDQDTDVGLTDVWRNTPLHYFTSELAAVSGVAESVVNVLTKKSQRFFVRNIVDVSMSMPVMTSEISDHQRDAVQHTAAEVARLNSQHMIQEHSVNFFCPEKLDADWRGNTPLHYAVGVYAQFKMFRINANVTETVDFLVKCGADINAQNNDGLTPLHVARGEEAIEACLRHTDEKSFTITDKRGRNFWHLLFLTRTQNDSELGRSIRPMIAKPDPAKYNVDDLNNSFALRLHGQK